MICASVWYSQRTGAGAAWRLRYRAAAASVAVKRQFKKSDLRRDLSHAICSQASRIPFYVRDCREATRFTPSPISIMLLYGDILVTRVTHSLLRYYVKLNFISVYAMYVLNYRHEWLLFIASFHSLIISARDIRSSQRRRAAVFYSCHAAEQ